MLKDLTAFIGEGIHTSLRKFCESKASQIAWDAINVMPDREWDRICRIVAQEILKHFDVQTRDAHLPNEAEKRIQSLDEVQKRIDALGDELAKNHEKLNPTIS